MLTSGHLIPLPPCLRLQFPSYDGPFGDIDGPDLLFTAWHAPVKELIAIGQEIFKAKFGGSTLENPPAVAHWEVQPIRSDKDGYRFNILDGVASHLNQADVNKLSEGLRLMLGDDDLDRPLAGQLVERVIRVMEVTDFEDFCDAFRIHGSNAEPCVRMAAIREGDQLLVDTGMAAAWDQIDEYRRASEEAGLPYPDGILSGTVHRPQVPGPAAPNLSEGPAAVLFGIGCGSSSYPDRDSGDGFLQALEADNRA